MNHWICEDEPDLTIPEDMIVRARVQDIKTGQIEYTDKKTGELKTLDKMTWIFEVVEQGKYNGKLVYGELVGKDAKLTNHPSNKFRQWVEAVLGRDVGVDFQLSRDDLIGLQVKISVRHEKGFKDPDRVFERIDEVLSAGDFVDEPPF